MPARRLETHRRPSAFRPGCRRGCAPTYRCWTQCERRLSRDTSSTIPRDGKLGRVTSGAERRPFGWAGTVDEFLREPTSVVELQLREHLFGLLRVSAAKSQVEAWQEELQILRQGFRDVTVARPESLDWGLVLEYELHLEGGRRPDVVLLTGEQVVTLEFKHTDRVHVADVDQVAAYARDLAEYHAGTHHLPSTPVLVPTGLRGMSTEVDGVRVIARQDVSTFLSELPSGVRPNVEEWIDAQYLPLPGLVEAARMIFRQQGLPRIRRCWSSGVPEAVAFLGSVVDASHRDSGRAIAFLAGVPGAGKTLAGLQLVYERSETHGTAVFLSGNGPLVEVLRAALDSKVFVRDLHAFIKTYGLSRRVPDVNVIVFDEAQRAWDAAYMMHKRGVDESEPDLLITVGERVPGWCSLVGLVGDGQEIHAGEEAGIRQWADAVRGSSSAQWTVYCPSRMGGEFSGLNPIIDDRLDLTISLRSRQAERLHDWVAALLAGELRSASRLAQMIRAGAFPMYLTRDLGEAKDYVVSRYVDDPEARYGLIASSRTQSFLPKYGVDSSWPATKKVKYARWYNNPRGEVGSGCNFEDVVTEFGCQGLEVDMPIVAWGNDLTWAGHDWYAKRPRGGYPLDDPEQLRLNAYRVLLTRGRDGLVIFVPDDPALDSTEVALLAAGVQPLPAALSIAV